MKKMCQSFEKYFEVVGTGISPMANICSLCAWQASLPISERQIRTHIRASNYLLESESHYCNFANFGVARVGSIPTESPWMKKSTPS